MKFFTFVISENLFLIKVKNCVAVGIANRGSMHLPVVRASTHALVCWVAAVKKECELPGAVPWRGFGRQDEPRLSIA
ncbi:MAG: hypothetical protein ACT4QA_22240 [Panacagrimonas sp.]